MAVAARKPAYEELYAPVTRVYSYRAATAPVLEPEEETPRPAAKAAHKQRRIGMKLLSMAAVFACAGVLLVVLVRYAIIAGEYSAVNELKAQIAERQRTIDSLNVQLNGAVSFEQAREAALSAGMGYPAAEQIIRVAAPPQAEEEEEAASVQVLLDGQ